MANFQPVQVQPFRLAGAGTSVTDVTITLRNFNKIDGGVLTMADFGGAKGYVTLEPGAGVQEEQASFTGITVNGDGTVTLTGVAHVAFVTLLGIIPSSLLLLAVTSTYYLHRGNYASETWTPVTTLVSEHQR
jgi:hypothetical protein